MKTYEDVKKMLELYENYLKRDDLREDQINRAKAHIETLNWIIMGDLEFALYGGEFEKDKS